MSEEGPNNKAEIQDIFRRLRQTPANRTCFDCGAKAPTWSSVTYGVFICIDCSAVHRSLGVHLSFVRSTQLDLNWTWTQLRSIQLGGNANAQAFFSQHHCSTTDAQQKYNSRAAQLYREKLSQLVAKHNKLHGYKIVFESEETSEVNTEKDFFEDMKNVQDNVQDLKIDSLACLVDLKNKNGASTKEQGPGPSVEGITSPTGSAGPRKSTIGAKRPANKLGAKKVGLGAQKVKADFTAIQKEAEMMDEMKEQQETQAKVDASKRVEEEERQQATMSLTYQEISKQQKKRAELLKSADPKKAEQVERLGMGVGVRAGVSHSVLSEMHVIEQENPSSSSSSKSKSKYDSFFDDYEIVETSNERGSSFLSGLESFSKSSDFDRPSKPKVEEDEFLAALNSTSRPKTKEPTSSSASIGNEAQKKFGIAKAISSDQMFGDSREGDMNNENQSLPSAGVDVSPYVEEVPTLPTPAPGNVIQKWCFVCGLHCPVNAASGLNGLKKEMMELVQLHIDTSLKETDATKKEVELCNFCCTNLQAWNRFYMNTRIMRNRSLLPSSAVLSNSKYCVICFRIRGALPFGQREGERIFMNSSSTETPQWKLTTEMAQLIAQLHIQLEWEDNFESACLVCVGWLRVWLSWKKQNLRPELLASHLSHLRSAELNLSASQQQNRGLKRKREAEPTEVEVVDIE